MTNNKDINLDDFIECKIENRNTIRSKFTDESGLREDIAEEILDIFIERLDEILDIDPILRSPDYNIEISINVYGNEENQDEDTISLGFGKLEIYLSDSIVKKIIDTLDSIAKDIREKCIPDLGFDADIDLYIKSEKNK